MIGLRQRPGLVYLMATVFCISLAPLGYAETDTDLDGAKALQFEITDNFNLSAFQGAAISLKKHTSNSFAWRLGLDLNLQVSDQESASERDYEAYAESIRDENSQIINLRLQGLFYPHHTAGIRLFYGFGPVFGFSHRKSVKVEERIEYNRITENTSKLNTWKAGLTGVLGVEWFPAKRISLLAEYVSEFTYEYMKSTSESVAMVPDDIFSTKSETINKNVRFYPAQVRFGLSVYF
jgi:hypothetical protein